MKLQGLYLIADTAQLAAKEPGAYIASLLECGVKLIQFRDKIPPSNERALINKRYRLARIIQAQCRIYDAPFIVNDDVDLAMEIDADGVHLGQSDMAVREARRHLGDNKYIGASCYASVQKAIQAQQDGADYVAFGAVFHSATKPHARRLGASAAQSLHTLAALNSQIDVPTCAIGGITPDNAKHVIDCGVHMIAVASGILKAANPQHAVKQYRTAWS